jgi:hypothetical protein
MKTFYTYAYLREDGTPYYIGKGSGSRAYKNNRKIPRPPKDRILLLKKNLTEEEAFRHEVYMIAVLGRKDIGTGILRNFTDGGEGISGLRHTASTKEKIGEANTGKTRTEITRKKLSELTKGFKWYTDGEISIQSRSHPGEGWTEGRNANWESHTTRGMSYYNRDGVNALFKVDPGDGWVRGRAIKKYENTTNRGKSWYNNGVSNRMFVSPPDDSWTPGMMRRK